MRVGFVIADGMRHVGYERTMDLNSTFGDILEAVCDVFNWQEDDFEFLFENRFTIVQKHWIPSHMGMKDEDYVKIYCVRKTNPHDNSIY